MRIRKNENTFWDYIPPFKANKAWCSTKVDESGKHVNGERMFGICGNGCPFPENESKLKMDSSSLGQAKL